ncbi:MAG: hypothetical protein ACN0LA_06785, partial [Candidatus Longimicrobiales bacterium M2_2A_002]
VPADDWVDAFHAAHEARYGFARRGAPVELVTARVEAVGPAAAAPAPSAPPDGGAGRPGEGRQLGRRETAVRYRGEEVDATIVARELLEEGDVVTGPAVVHEYSATLWLPPAWRATRLPGRALEVERVRAEG